MIRKGMIIKHEKFMDVAFKVYKVFGPFGTEGYQKVKGEWVNAGYVKSYCLGITQSFEIERKDLKNWLFCLEPQSECIRHANWSNI